MIPLSHLIPLLEYRGWVGVRRREKGGSCGLLRAVAAVEHRGIRQGSGARPMTDWDTQQ